MTWTEKTRESETWVPKAAPVVGVGFSQGFSARPNFMVASGAGIWVERDREAETWTPA